MRRLGLAILLMGAVLTGCEAPYGGYSYDEEGFYYKLHALGDGEAPIKSEDYLLVNVLYGHPGDRTVLMHHDTQFFYHELAGSIMHKMLSHMQEGDSASFILPATAFQPSRVDTTKFDSVQVSLGVTDAMNAAEHKAYIEKLAWKRDQEMNEAIEINYYMMHTELPPVYDLQGMKFIPIETGRGTKVQNGKDVVVQYEARFLNGDVFDSTRGENQLPLEFQMGAPGQVIKGLEIGLKELYTGGKAIFIMPSQFAFGERGVPDAGIPPFTPVIYEVEVVSVK